MTAPTNIVIVGAGIIGVSTAYHLSHLSPTATIHLLEASPTFFSSASGNAAGFLARDWFPSATASLGELSFDLHKKLAEEHDGARRWGYSPSAAFSLAPSGSGDARGEDWLFEGTSRALMAGAKAGDAGLPEWLALGQGAQGAASVEALSSGDSTAQVNPLQLSQFLLEQCRSRGMHLHHPVTPTQIHTSPDNTVTNVTVLAADGTSTTLRCDALVLTAGVWTQRVFATLFPSSNSTLPISQLSGHSLVLRSPRWSENSYVASGCAAAFATDPDAGFAPEIFSRAGGDIYLAGLNTTAIPVSEPDTPTPPNEESIAQLKNVAKRLLGDDELDVLKAGFCHRPVTKTGVPLITKLSDGTTGVSESDVGGVWVSAGHGPWGISLSLGTGLVLAEMVLGKPPSADISELRL